MRQAIFGNNKKPGTSRLFCNFFEKIQSEHHNYVVVRKDAPKDSLARRMVDFMLTPAGQDCVSNAGYGPLIAG